MQGGEGEDPVVDIPAVDILEAAIPAGQVEWEAAWGGLACPVVAWECLAEEWECPVVAWECRVAEVEDHGPRRGHKETLLLTNFIRPAPCTSLMAPNQPRSLATRTPLPRIQEQSGQRMGS